MSATTASNPSIVLYGAGKAQLEERPVPSLDNPCDVIIRIGSVGVCGSDVHFWAHGGIGSFVVSEDSPLVMGHEAAGTIHSVGTAVKHLKPGDRVAIEPGEPCYRCVRCKEGLYNLCPDLRFAACPPDGPGTLSKFWKSPADMCYKLPDNVTLEEGLLVEPLAVAVHSVRMVNVRPGQTVVVFGAGTVGLLSAAVAYQYGASKVIVVDIADHRLEFAKQFLGAGTFKPDVQADPQENARTLIDDNELGIGADAVVEASGAESSTNTAIYALRLGGNFVQTGLGKPIINFPIMEMSMKEIHAHGCCRYGPGDFATAMQFVVSGSIKVAKLISHSFPFEKATDAWEATRRGEGIKNIIRGVED